MGDVPDEWFSARLKELREKRDFVVSRLQTIPGLTCVIPQGAFYVLPDLTGCLGPGAKVSDGDEFCKVLLQDYQVALVPGGAFQAPAAFRVSYAATMEDLTSATDAIIACVKQVRGASAETNDPRVAKLGHDTGAIISPLNQIKGGA